MKKKPIAITMGEPSGISSEIVLKTWLNRKKKKLPNFFVIDDFNKIQYINQLFKLNVKFKLIKKPEEAEKYFESYLPIIDMKIKMHFNLGTPLKNNSKFVLRSINKALKFVMQKNASAMITLPVCKKTIIEGGFKFKGQTEYISKKIFSETKKKNEEIMILTTRSPIDNGKNLIIGLLTTHDPLIEVIKKKINKKEIIKKICAFKKSLQKIWLIKNPRIGVCGVNPHAGEGGLIGSEERKVIIPVIKELKKKKINLFGPLSSDSCFSKSIREKYDAIFCIYHDQGLIPIKILDFSNSINVTGGLPIIRVSPDHGPAFDIAKKNIASIDSIISSIKFIDTLPNENI